MMSLKVARFTPLVVVLLIGGVVAGPLLKSQPRKNLAGPPSEFKDNQLPEPIASALTEESAFFEIWLQAKENHKNEEKFKLVWEADVNVDSSEEFTLSFFSPHELKLKLFNPDGKKVDLDGHKFEGQFPIGEASVPEVTYRFKNPTVGVWHVKVATKEKVTRDQAIGFANSATPHAAILLWNKAPLRMFSHLNTYNLHLGQEIGLVASMTSDTKLVEGVRPTILTDIVTDAEMDMVLPDGSEVDVPLHDDGLHGDFGASDGVYGASIVATETGVYQAKAVIKGVSNNVAWVRTTQHMIPVVNPDLSLSTSAWGEMQDKERMNIFIEVESENTQDLYRAYAEVYAKDSSNNDIPVCWIANMADVQEVNGKKVVAMELNLKWLALVNAKAPITLKNVVVQETTSFVPISRQSEISVQTSNVISTYVSNFPLQVTEITREMRVGLATLKRTNLTAGNGKLIGVHGYCSGDNPWQDGGFTNALYFLKPNANINNQQFAEEILQFAQANGADVFSIVGHSQGGMAALHLLNYFESGLDFSENGRRIQSVGTPYKGCSAAGSAASLGKTFGVGCGEQGDLTVGGAKLWLAGIPQDSQKEVYFYTTTYEQGTWFGDYCNMAINAILEWPNDGTSELQYATLPYGNYMGNTQKQCHTTDMKYLAQYDDLNRNRVMNENAAR